MDAFLARKSCRLLLVSPICSTPPRGGGRAARRGPVTQRKNSALSVHPPPYTDLAQLLAFTAKSNRRLNIKEESWTWLLNDQSTIAGGGKHAWNPLNRKRGDQTAFALVSKLAYKAELVKTRCCLLVAETVQTRDLLGHNLLLLIDLRTDNLEGT